MPRILLVGALAIAALLAVYGTIPRPFGMALVLAFLLTAPGLSWIDRFGDLSVAEVCVLSVGLSLALDIVVGCVLAFGFWSPKGGLGALLAVAAAGLACSRRRDNGG
jgi:hypothetical protein